MIHSREHIFLFFLCFLSVGLGLTGLGSSPVSGFDDDELGLLGLLSFDSFDLLYSDRL